MDKARDPYVTTSLADGLRKLTDLREEGALTEAEFEAAKAEMFVIPPDVIERDVRKLADLREEGALTEAEFEVAKSQILVPPPEALNVTAGGSEVYVLPPHILNSIPLNSPKSPRRR